MELTPQSARSPTSPYRYIPNPQPLYEYPSPAQSDSRYKSTDSLLGYSCSMSESAGDNEASLTSPTAASNWPTGAHHPHDTPRSSHSTPNILSADYDPFAPYHPGVSAAYTHDIYSTQTAEVSVLPASPVPSESVSQRSSFSSAPPSDVFIHTGPANSYAPRIKMEEHPEYSHAHDPMLMSSSDLNQSLLVTSASPYTGTLENSFYPDPTQMSWPKLEYSNAQDLPSISSLPIPPYDRRSESQDRGPSLSQKRISNVVPRSRQPRKLTTKEDANFQCQVKGCGKLFGRSYNFKAHMETHDAGREYPFPCQLKDCNKKFVRKTDLQRHHQSVHMKQRNHRCDYCSRYFARKDTLRRHMEDGCSKRFDIETVDFRPQSYSQTDQHSLKVPSGTTETQSRHGSYSSSVQYSPPPEGSAGPLHQERPCTLTTDPGTFLDRQEYLAGDHNQHPLWPH